MIEEAYSSSIHSRYHAPRQSRSLIHSLKVHSAATTTNFFYLDMVYTPKGYIKEITERFTFAYNDQIGDLDIEMEPGTDFYLKIEDAAAALTVNITYIIFEATRPNAQYPAL